MDRFALQAQAECNSDTHTVRRAGVGGKPFWNVNSSQFMFVPQLSFPAIPGANSYLYTARDAKGGVHTFEDVSPIAPLTPIWKDIPVGYVTLTVEALHCRGEKFLAGTRTFYKTACFPGREALPPRARSYKESALLAFRYLLEDRATQYWLTHGTPDPEYYHNVYPSKMISSIASAMIAYARLEPSRADEAMTLARNAADYLLSITYEHPSPLAGMPPTYSFKGLNRATVNANAPAAEGREHTLMMIYPAMVGSMYIELAEATKEMKYLEAAKRIGEYYKSHVLPSGSWYLLLSSESGEPLGGNTCLHFSILSFLHELFEETGDPALKTLEKDYYRHIEKNCLDLYNWEGQFEDVKLTPPYANLTHLNAGRMVSYIAKNMANDEQMMKQADQLARFVEDQFVVWGEYAPWNRHLQMGGFFHSPAALEQYEWYVPIDGSTSAVIRTLLDLYAVRRDPLLLEKACALGDSITRLQDGESGVIPTHWMSRDCTHELYNFWINCHIGTAHQMLYLAEVTGEI